ncbi:molybdate ABC transporter substrate-binding protein [Oricola sp.]|uniref:molybdate ABC transporter substrate-binding protein n=1 Tax=Oricola sp. TaxID=1979950 RepID=UPI003BAA8E36
MMLIGHPAARRIARIAGIAALLLAMPLSASADSRCSDGGPVVFAAASLTDAVNELATAFHERHGCTPAVTTAGSSTLARQIAAGAPADVFISASREWMAWLEKNAPDRLAGAPVTVARNRLVIVTGHEAAANSVNELLTPRFAMGDPAHVPAGIYARAALGSLGQWEALAPHAVYAENVRVALAMATRGDVGAAIVYATDARLQPKLTIGLSFDAATHPDIIYQAVTIAGNDGDGQNFIDLMRDATGQAILSDLGFLPGDPSGSQ